MEVYKGPHLVINHEQANSRLISTWKSSPPNDLAYRKELIQHLYIVQEIKPAQVMWLMENLTFKIDDATKIWADENISKPIFKSGFIAKRQDGFHQVAIIVGHDVLAYLEVTDIFNEHSSSGFKPKYFATETEAKSWLNGDLNIKDFKSGDELTINFKGIDDKGKAVFEFKEQISNFASTINSFKTIIEQPHFIKNNIDKFSNLTKREKETLKFIINGDDNKQIAEKMHVSPNTIRTHRNRIWKKLEIQNLRECLRYSCFFN